MVSKDILGFFANYIEKESGIIYAEHNYYQLQNRLEDISKLMGFSNIEHLHEAAKVEIQGPLRQFLIDFATNNETSFFRDTNLFKAIENQVLTPLLEKNGPDQNLRVWSAASSTGQEAVTLAILIHEFNLKNKCAFNFTILGTDISERALTKAREGTYTQLEVQRGLPTPLLVKYFKKTGDDRWQVKPEISKHLEFKKMNLKTPFPTLPSFQLVLCRNVLIYQAVEAKSVIIERISDEIAPGGFLALGSGESLIGLSTRFETVSKDNAILYRLKG